MQQALGCPTPLSHASPTLLSTADHSPRTPGACILAGGKCAPVQCQAAHLEMSAILLPRILCLCSSQSPLTCVPLCSAATTNPNKDNPHKRWLRLVTWTLAVTEDEDALAPQMRA